MVTVKTLQQHLFSLVRVAQKHGVHIKYGYKGEVYLLTIEPTYERYKINKIGPRFNSRKKPAVMKMDNCPKCNGIVISGICISRICK